MTKPEVGKGQGHGEGGGQVPDPGWWPVMPRRRSQPAVH